jgi:predicted helicase
MRELRGVYYTPEPVVSYIVRSVDHLLKTRFNRPKGLADENTLILDPACGTGTFLYFVIREIYQKFAAQKGAWDGEDGYVAQHLLSRIFGFELLMAPYAVAHLKLSMELHETGYSFGSDQRLGIYLTNTLEEAAKKSEKLFAQWISDEANAAASIKRDLPIMVVMGNPPYSGHSANRSWEIDNRGKKVPNFIGRLLQDYYKVDGQPLGERNPKWLQDDYVKFLRFGQWRIERTGAGVLAFITNHGYLDNPTFRGMRQQLMRAFTDIYILNLHGNAKKKEVCPDASKDENVFDIQQGVAIGVFVRGPVEPVAPLCERRPDGAPAELGDGRRSQTGATARVHYADLWGLQKTKYDRLFETDVAACKWATLDPQSPFYFFTPQEIGLRAEYERGWKVTDATSESSVGITTGRDKLCVSFAEEEALAKLREFTSDLPEEQLARKYGLSNKSGWKIERARNAVRKAGVSKNKVCGYLYRPFDSRVLYLDEAVVGRSRLETMRNMVGGKNLALCTNREVNGPFRHVLCTRRIANDCAVSLQTRERTYLFPLYLYPSVGREKRGQGQLALSGRAAVPAAGETGRQDAGATGRRPNLNPAFIADLEKRLGLKFVPDGRGDLKNSFGPEDVFNYTYAVFHSPTYRTRYAEFLKIDFPRLPLTSDVNRFRALCEKGAELVALHLLESPTLENPITGYPVKGSNMIEKGFPKYVAPGEPEPGTGKRLKAGRVYINAAAPDYDRGGPGVILSASEESRHFEMKKTLRSAQGDKPLQKDRGQYFEGVRPEVWNFHIGGYQVCEKWLKDRRGRTLSYDDTTHYQKIIVALKETIRLMAEIDAAIPKWPIE